ncbi:hypothetical protein DESC_260060 [Desulfosarcina cetonica]|nr:hypothetical protein DESC_260060 [Desulfosarcina cetonica]
MRTTMALIVSSSRNRRSCLSASRLSAIAPTISTTPIDSPSALSPPFETHTTMAMLPRISTEKSAKLTKLKKR